MQLTPILLANLTDAAWRKISEKSGLPNEARPKIEQALQFYRICSRDKSLKPPAATKRDLRTLSNTLDQALRQLTTVLSNPRAQVVLRNEVKKASGDPTLDQGTAQHGIEAWVCQLTEIKRMTTGAEKSVASGARGAWEQSRVLTMFVWQLDKIFLEFKGRHISRSHKGHLNALDYVTAVCSVADPEITPSSIDEAMKLVIKARGRKQQKKRG